MNTYVLKKVFFSTAFTNKSEAARCLGITRSTLHKKLKKYGIMPADEFNE
jgi:DNA-binding protein Fis